jgi:hypothetical protein
MNELLLQAKLSGAKNVTLPMLRQKIDDADASAAQAQVTTDHCVPLGHSILS